ncbi:MAG: MBL fold metallo-hydrolase [Anaerolineales bacterium]|nr:MBL fold metallo-hydrolase [Anaerolineales bacterium]
MESHAASPAVEPVQVLCLTLGPVQTNTYIVGDISSRTAVVIDPAWDGAHIHQQLDERGWSLASIWLTHAHFDHFGGVADLVRLSPGPPAVALHPLDQALWRLNGGAGLFGIPAFDPGPEPGVDLSHGMQLQFGRRAFEVRHAPGHTPGHVMFYWAADRLLFSGDVIFAEGVGRTDLPGGNWEALLSSIQSQVLTLPDDVTIYSGHGPATTVGRERRSNPFLHLT